MVREELDDVHETIRACHPMLLFHQRAFRPNKTETHLRRAPPRSDRGQEIHHAILGLPSLHALLIRGKPHSDPLAHGLRCVRFEPGADEGLEHGSGGLTAGDDVCGGSRTGEGKVEADGLEGVVLELLHFVFYKPPRQRMQRRDPGGRWLKGRRIETHLEAKH